MVGKCWVYPVYTVNGGKWKYGYIILLIVFEDKFGFLNYIV